MEQGEEGYIMYHFHRRTVARAGSENYYHCRFVVRTGGENGASVWHKPFSLPVPFEARDENLSPTVL